MRSWNRRMNVALTFLLIAVISSSGSFVKQQFISGSGATKSKTETMASGYSSYASAEVSNGSISVVPSVLNLTATHVGQTFNFTVWINDSANIAAWQVRIDFNDTVLNMTDWEEPANDSRYIFAGKTTFTPVAPPDGSYVHDALGKGHVEMAAILYPTAQQPSSGTGKLCAVAFKIQWLPQAGQGLTLPLHINTTDTYVLDPDSGTEIKNVAKYDGTVQIESRALSVQLLSPGNETYTTNSVMTNFTIDGQASWIGYSLNGQANVTITGNTTLSDLSEGTHDIIVYVNDTDGNTYASSKIWFTIQTPSSLPPMIWIVGAIAIVAFVVLGLAYYFVRKRRKHTRLNK